MEHPTQPSDNNLWRVDPGSEEDYWQAYEAMRPKYADSSFLERIYDYHASKFPNMPPFEVAHDVACGSGKASIEIAKRFKHVIASDSNTSSINALQKSQMLSTENIRYEQCAAEELSLHYPPGSADLVSAAQCFPLMDSPVALSSFARVLKPHGTLAIWFYGRPHFSEREYMTQCQPIFDQILNLTFGKVIKGGNTSSKATWKRAADGMASWLDNVDLSSGEWDLMQRRKWNSGTAEMGFGPGACDFDIEPTNNVGNTEEIIAEEDPQIWEGSWDVKGVRKYVNYSFPHIRSAVESDTEIGKLFEQLTEAMGYEDATRLYTWPIVLILATRSSS